MSVTLTEAAETVLKRRYYLKDKDGNCIENWGGLCRRVAKHVANGDEVLENEFFWMINELYFLPNSPTLMNAGTDIGNLSACFVLPVEDSMEGIFDAIKWGALVHKTGGGTGYSFSNLRGKNSPVKSTAGVASGPVSFAEVFNAATETIKQGGKRRGANMGVLHVDHPDIDEFITVKSNPDKLTNFNLSVAITDDFMQKVIENDPESRHIFDLIVDRAHASGEPGVIYMDAANRANPTQHLGEYQTTNPCVTGDTLILTQEYGSIPITEVAGRVVNVWNGDEWSEVIPTITGYDQQIIKVKTSVGTLKCTERHVFHLSGGATKCAFELLVGDKLQSFKQPDGSMVEDISISNLSLAGIEDKVYCFIESRKHMAVFNGVLTGQCGEQFLLPFNSCNLGSINLTKFVKKIVPRTDDRDWPNNDYEIDYTLLDKVTKIATIFLDKAIDVNKFPLPQIDKATKETRNIGLGIMGLHDMLIRLKIPYASEQGLSKAAEVMSRIKEVALATSEELASIDGAFPAFIPGTYSPRKNANLTTCAPTGTISMVANCSSGMEPNFGYVMVKNVMDQDHLLMVNPLFESVAKENGFYSKELLKKVSETGSVMHSEIPEYWQHILWTAQDITPEWHVRMQAAIQTNGNDSGTSKTVNLPESATKQDIEDIYMLAWKLGCKGVTVYRNNCRANQVLNTVGNLEKQQGTVNTAGPVKADLPDVLNAKRYKLKLDDNENIYIIICFDDINKPMEIFAKFPFSNRHEYKDKSVLYTCVCRLISLGLRYGIPVEEIIKQLDKSSGSMVDLPAQLTKLLKMFLSETDKPYSAPCPECGDGLLVFEEGCACCKSCGYSKCS